MFDSLTSLWEVPDNLPTQPVDLIVGLSMPQAKDGSCSRILKSIVSGCVEMCRRQYSDHIVYANRFTVNDQNLAEIAKRETLRMGVPESVVIIPHNPRLPRIRNTFQEVLFALRLVRYSRCENRSILIVANHLHMRRVLAAVRVLAPASVKVYWHSVKDLSAYGSDAAQHRYLWPITFFVYELAACAYSKAKGWA